MAGGIGGRSPAAGSRSDSVLTLGIFWVGQQTRLSRFARGDRHLTLTLIHLAFLFAISLMPVSTALLAAVTISPTTLPRYWSNIVTPGASRFASWR